LVEPPEVDRTPKKIKGKKTKGEEPSSPPPHASGTAGEAQEQGEGKTASPEQSTRDRRGTSGRAKPRGTEPVSDDALAVVDGAVWPLGKPRPTPVDRQRLAVAADACVAAGHTLVDVRRELAAAIDAQRPVGAAITRLRQLAGTTPIASRTQSRAHTTPADPGAPSQPATGEQHPYRTGPNGACSVCGRPEASPVHPAKRRATARCEHGRVPLACPACRPTLIGANPSNTATS